MVCPPASACQHHSLELSRDSRKPTDLEKRIIFLTIEAGMSLKTKHRCGKSEGKAGMSLKTKVFSP
jgi:hypothetical protein